MSLLGSIGSSLFDFATSAWSANQQADRAAGQAQISRDWQEKMANTQYQRTVEDLNKAGLSPMLAYSKGASSLPSGATASISGQASSDLGGAYQRSTQRDLADEQIQVARSTVNANNAQAAKSAAEADNVRQDTENKKLYPGLSEAQINELIARAGQHGASSGQLKALMDEVRQTINLRKPEEQFKQENPTYSKYASPVMDALNTIFKGIGAIRGNSAVINTTTTHPDGSKSTTNTTRSR